MACGESSMECRLDCEAGLDSDRSRRLHIGQVHQDGRVANPGPCLLAEKSSPGAAVKYPRPQAAPLESGAQSHGGMDRCGPVFAEFLVPVYDPAAALYAGLGGVSLCGAYWLVQKQLE
jgi:hypothetical protein